jgi:hypothetical protein
VPHDGKLVMAARGGFAARGLLYGLIGYLAWLGHAKDPSGAMSWASRHGGAAVMIPLGLGFLAYATWRLLAAAFDADDHGSDLKGVLVRIGGACIGFIYLGFALITAKLTLFNRGSGGPSAADQGAATALDLPGGPYLLYGAAACFLGAGLWQFFRAWKLKFLKRLTRWACRSPIVAWIGRIGLAARGCVFVTVAWLFLQAANHMRASEAGGSAEALRALPPNIRAAIGIGLILFGVFSLVEAWFRDIGDPEVGDHVKKALA